MSKQALGKSIINKFFDKSFFETEIGRPRKVTTWKIIRAIIYKLCTGIQWKYLPIQSLFKKDKYSWQSVYYHYNKWSNASAFTKALQRFISTNKQTVNCTIINLDGSHTPAKKGGEKTAYQGRKKAKTSNIIFLTDQQGLPLGCSKVISGNHNDAYELEKTAAKIFNDIESCSINLNGVFLNADAGFDTKEFIALCESKGIVPNIDFNKRNGVDHENRSYVFDNDMYRKRFVVERTNAWIDNFRTLLIRHERKARNWLQFHYLAFLIMFLQKNFNIERTF